MSKTTETDTFRRLKAFMKDVDGNQRQIIKCLQDQVEYLVEKNRIYEEVAVEKNGGKHLLMGAIPIDLRYRSFFSQQALHAPAYVTVLYHKTKVKNLLFFCMSRRRKQHRSG